MSGDGVCRNTSGSKTREANELLSFFQGSPMEIRKLLTTIRASKLNVKAVAGNDLVDWAEATFSDHSAWARSSVTGKSEDRNWTREEIISLFEELLLQEFLQHKKRNTESDLTETDDTKFGDSKSLYTLADPALIEIRQLKQKWRTKRIVEALVAENYKPYFPILLIPGYGASSLAVWESEERRDWEEERIWVGLRKIGSLARIKKLEGIFKKPKKCRKLDETDYDNSRVWLRHMMLAEDCHSDPPGIKVRPLEGISGVDYLSHSSISKNRTFVFGPLIKTLKHAGYKPSNLKAAPYDWRLPLPFLEERDGYFSTLKSQISDMVQFNERKVVVVAHSMGNRIFQLFLRWVNEIDSSWIDENIHAHMALGAPFLGAPKSVRGLLSGDALGLESFLLMQEALVWNRRTGSLCTLLPICPHFFPQQILNVKKKSIQFIPQVVADSPKQNDNAATVFRNLNDVNEYPAWYTKIIGNWDDVGCKLLPLSPHYLKGKWIQDTQKSDSMEGFQRAIRDSKGMRSKLVETSEKGINFLFKFKNSDSLQAKATLHGFTARKFSVPFTQSFNPTSAKLPEDYSWFDKNGTILCSKNHRKWVNLFICFRLNEKGLLQGRIVICPHRIEEDMKLTVFTLYWTKDINNSLTNAENKLFLNTPSVGKYYLPNIYSLLQFRAPDISNIFEEYYINCSLYLNLNSKSQLPNNSEDKITDIPILQPPPVENLWSIYGTGLDTEVSYYYKVSPSGEFEFDFRADQHSRKKTDVNPAGLKLKEGIGYETVNTIQRDDIPNSGDGTVPYASLSFANHWKNELADPNSPIHQSCLRKPNIEIIEVNNCEHREMLADEIVHYHVLQYVCKGTNPFAA